VQALLVTLLHLGALHGYEKLLVAVIAVGPFLVLAVVVSVLRRRDLAADRRTTTVERDPRSTTGS
jgi:hypothetical protein